MAVTAVAKAIYRRYEAKLQIRYSQPERQYPTPNISWSQFPNSGETKTLISYYTSYGFSETEGIYGIGETGIWLNISDGNGSSTAKARGYKYITPTKAYLVDIYDDSRGYADITCVSCSTSTKTESYTRGAYLTDIVLDFGSVSENERAEDGYWYEFVKPASDSRVMVGGIWKDANESYACVNGILRPVDEIKVSVGGIWK